MIKYDQASDLNQVMEDLSKLHEEIHENDVGPKNDMETEADVLIRGIRQVVLSLIYDGCNVDIIELSLFYFWHHMFVRNVDLEAEAGNLPFGDTIPKAVQLIQGIAETIKDDRQTDEMAALGSMVDQLKNGIREIAIEPKNRQQIRSDTEKVNGNIFEFINIVMRHGMNPVLVQNTLLYYWLRCSIINVNADEIMFQKVERNWPEVIKDFNPAYLDFIKSKIQEA